MDSVVVIINEIYKFEISETTDTVVDNQQVTKCIALNENELASRWGLSVKTLRRWRREQLGPVFCKLGARVTYLIPEIEGF